MLADAEFWRAEYERALTREQNVTFGSFTYDDAWSLGTTLVESGRRSDLPIAISIMFGEQRVFHAALAGSSALNDDWIDRKIRVVAKHNMSSYGVGCLYRSRGEDYDEAARYERGRFAAFGGGLPIRVGGILAGVVAVSGLAEKEDHELALDSLATLLTKVGNSQ